MSIGQRKIKKSNYLTSNFGVCMTIVFWLGFILIASIEAQQVTGFKKPYYSISDM